MLHRFFCKRFVISSQLFLAEGKYQVRYTDTVCNHGVKKGFYDFP